MNPTLAITFELSGEITVRSMAAGRVCNRLSGYSGYSDIRKNLSVQRII